MAITERIKRKSKETSQIPAKPHFGDAGAPIDRGHPFYFGFVATLGALSAFVLMRALASASQVFILIIVALFLATGLNPAVEALRRRGMSRSTAVGIIFATVITMVIIFAAVLVPPIVRQGSHLINIAPSLLADLKNNPTFANINDHYGIIDSLQKKLGSVTKDGTLLISAFGGVIGVGKTVISGTFTALTILVLTLYFTTSLPQATDLALKLVPASRRDRVSLLTDAIISRVGAFVGSQILIGLLASVVLSIFAAIAGLPSPVAIGVVIFVCGLVPLVGHMLGAAIMTIIALTQSVTIGIATLAFYIVYVQIENYVITPRIMKRRLAVPGAVTIISALIGSSLLGLIGGILAIPVAASIILILDEVVIPRADQN
jgi:predicted PurR-regulated permease PerM